MSRPATERYRYQLLLEASERPQIQTALTRTLPAILALDSARRVGVSLDVDPTNLGW